MTNMNNIVYVIIEKSILNFNLLSEGLLGMIHRNVSLLGLSCQQSHLMFSPIHQVIQFRAANLDCQSQVGHPKTQGKLFNFPVGINANFSYSYGFIFSNKFWHILSYIKIIFINFHKLLGSQQICISRRKFNVLFLPKFVAYQEFLIKINIIF